MIAQGEAAQQPLPWVTNPNFACFFPHSPPAEANEEKSSPAHSQSPKKIIQKQNHPSKTYSDADSAGFAA